MDDLTAGNLLQEWARGRGFSTTLMNDRLYFHSEKYREFAFVDFVKLPKVTLHVSNNPADAWMELASDVTIPCGDKLSNYELNLADKNVFTQIERILERTLDNEGWS